MASMSPGNKKDTATLWCKESGVFAGKPFADRIFERLHCVITWNVAEGDYIDASKGKVAVRLIVFSFLRFCQLKSRLLTFHVVL